MQYKSYEEVVWRDQPSHWWRIGTNGTIQSDGQPGSSVAMSNRSASQYAGPGIPGVAAGWSAHCLGTSNVANAQGWISASHTVPGNLTDGVSMEFWWMQVGGFTATRLYHGFTRGGSSQSSFTGFWFYENILAFTCGPTLSHQFQSSFFLPPQTWNHAVGILRNGNNELYVNGRRSRSISYGTPETSNPYADVITSNVTSIGHSRYADSRFYSFPGFIAEPAIYPYALSPSQIVEHYQAGITPRRATGRLGTFMYPFTATVTPGGLTAITEGLPNRRVLLVSDRPR